MNGIAASEGMHYEGNCIRPPPEAASILLQVTLGCSHNKCTFCGTFKDKPFRIKKDDIILSDILFAAKYMKAQDRVFLMDGDALIIPQKRLNWILDRIQEQLPWVKRVAAYANTRSIGLKSTPELTQLRRKGLGMLYFGVETGDDEIRKKINKGSSARQCLEMGKKVKRAGMQLTVTLLLGIAGRQKSLQQARATGKLPDKRELLVEMKELLTHTHLSRGLFSSNHASNYLPLRAWLPEGKQALLDSIDAALSGEIGLKPEWMRAF
jgi:radical SAM superfamily enzyme YgiQ (UPF0313 family)